MSNKNTVLLSHDKQQISKTIFSEISSSLEKTLNNEALSIYAKQTVETKKALLDAYKKGFQSLLSKLNMTNSVEEYFKAYEYILKFREFILGDAGKIDYTFTIRSYDKDNVYIDTITLGHETFKDLLFTEKYILGLYEFDGNLRFSSDFLKRLRVLIKQIKNQKMDVKISPDNSFFTLTNELLGTKQDFKDNKIMRANIDFYQRNRNVSKWYTFQFKVSKDISNKQGKRVFKYFVSRVNGNPASSSIFSAIGKYFADEMQQSKIFIGDHGLDIQPHYPNAGNLTELYILAKERLNAGHNVFQPRPLRKAVSGNTLFELYNQVKKNSEPFYAGGDVLMQQIKSFLGSNPSLTSYATIRNSVQNFFNALNDDSIEKIANQLQKLLIKNPLNSKNLSDSEKELSKKITTSFCSFFDQSLLKS